MIEAQEQIKKGANHIYSGLDCSPEKNKVIQLRSFLMESHNTAQQGQTSTDQCRRKHILQSSMIQNPYHLNSKLIELCDYPSLVRQKIISWLLQEGSKKYLLRQTCASSIYLLDLYWMMNGNTHLNELQLLGIACLNLSCKLNQTNMKPIQVDQNVFSKQTIQNFELQVLKTTNFKVNPVTYAHIASFLLKKWDESILAIMAQQLNPQNIRVQQLLFFPPNQTIQNLFTLQMILKIIGFYELLQCCILIKEMLQYDIQDLVYNCFYVYIIQKKQYFFHSFQSSQDFAFNIEQVIDRIFKENQVQKLYSNKWLLDKPIQRLINIVLHSLNKHRNLSESVNGENWIKKLYTKIPWATAYHLAGFQTWKPYYMKVVRQVSSQVAMLQQSFQI